MSKITKLLIAYAAIDLSSHAIRLIRWLWKKHEIENKIVDIECEEIKDNDNGTRK